MPERRLSHGSASLRELQPAPKSVIQSSDEDIATTSKQTASKRKFPTTSEACDSCRAKKAKCSGPPRCQTCTTRDIECTFKYHEGKKQLVTRNNYKSLQARLRELEATVYLFKVGSNEEIAKELLRLRNASGVQEDGIERWQSMDTPQKAKQPFQRPLKDVLENWKASHEGMSLTFAGSLVFVEPGIPADLEIYHETKLPSEVDVRAAFAAFENGASSLFFIMTPADSQNILHQFYGTDSREFDKVDLCLLCSFAAFGSHFIPETVSERSKQSLFRTALSLANECSNSLWGLCALSCLALFTLVEKKTSIKAILASALQIARWTRLNRNINSFTLEEYQSFRKVYRSLVILDSYLSTKLPYLSTISADEVNFAAAAVVDERPFGVDSFASELNSLALIAGNFTTEAYSSNRYDLAHVNSYMQQLTAWHEALPDDLRLAMLTIPGQGNRLDDMRTPILFLHETYLGIVVLLHRGLIPPILEQRLAGYEWSIDGSSAAASECYSRAVLTVHHSISITILLVHTSGAVFRQCWLSLYELFVCTSILLADTALSLFSGSSKGVEENMDRITAAIETMKCMRCHSVEQMAADLLGILQPLVEDVKGLQETRTPISQVHATDPSAASLLQQTVQLLNYINQQRFNQAVANA